MQTKTTRQRENQKETSGHSDDASQDTIRLYLSGLLYERVRQQTAQQFELPGERLFLPERKRTAVDLTTRAQYNDRNNAHEMKIK